MSTTSTSGRTVAHEHTGVATATVTNPGGDIEFHADAAVDRAVVTLTPAVPGDETAEDRIARAEITSTGEQFVVRLPDMPTTVTSGGTVIQSRGRVIQQTGVNFGNIVGGIHVSGSDIQVGGTHVVQTGGGGSVTVSVTAPAGSSLAARSQGGGIRQSGTASRVDADTSGGGIRVEHVTDELELNTSGGTIRIGTADCRAEARTSGGDVRANNLRRGGSLRTSGGDVRAHLAGNHRLTARTSGGDIELSTAAGVDEDHLTWRTSGGQVEVNDRARPASSR